MKIALVISSLSYGGAQRVLVLIAEGFHKKGYEVAVVTIDGIDKDFYTLSAGIQRVALDIAGNSLTSLHAVWNNLYRLWILRQVIYSLQPDVVISFLDIINIMTSLALTQIKYPVIATEHCVPSLLSDQLVWERLRRITYPNLEKIVSVSQGVDSYFDWLPKAKRTVIYNPIDPSALLQRTGKPTSDRLLDGRASSREDTRTLIAMGRLTKQKGFDLLLQAFARLKDIHIEWTLTILGEGELRTELECLREKLGLSGQVRFPGVVKNPYEILRLADIFVMSSRFEGFGNVLIEAMACGLPVIATDCPCGPREIIRDGVDGILVPNKDVEALATAMDRLMSDEGERKRLSDCASKAVERFSLEKVMGMWEELLDEVVEQRL